MSQIVGDVWAVTVSVERRACFVPRTVSRHPVTGVAARCGSRPGRPSVGSTRPRSPSEHRGRAAHLVNRAVRLTITVRCTRDKVRYLALTSQL